MKKLLCIILSAVFILTFTACANKKSEDENSQPQNSRTDENSEASGINSSGTDSVTEIAGIDKSVSCPYFGADIKPYNPDTESTDS